MSTNTIQQQQDSAFLNDLAELEKQVQSLQFVTDDNGMDQDLTLQCDVEPQQQEISLSCELAADCSDRQLKLDNKIDDNNNNKTVASIALHSRQGILPGGCCELPRKRIIKPLLPREDPYNPAVVTRYSEQLKNLQVQQDEIIARLIRLEDMMERFFRANDPNVGSPDTQQQLAIKERFLNMVHTLESTQQDIQRRIDAVKLKIFTQYRMDNNGQETVVVPPIRELPIRRGPGQPIPRPMPVKPRPMPDVTIMPVGPTLRLQEDTTVQLPPDHITRPQKYAM
eukprot:UN04663